MLPGELSESIFAVTDGLPFYSVGRATQYISGVLQRHRLSCRRTADAIAGRPRPTDLQKMPSVPLHAPFCGALPCPVLALIELCSVCELPVIVLVHHAHLHSAMHVRCCCTSPCRAGRCELVRPHLKGRRVLDVVPATSHLWCPLSHLSRARSLTIRSFTRKGLRSVRARDCRVHIAAGLGALRRPVNAQ